MNFAEASAPDLFKPELDFPVVGIGASAGGLEAVTEMFHDASLDTGIAYVLVLHLDPNHESLMAELLSRKTKLPVRQIEDGDDLVPDTLHVIPPGASLRMEGGKLRLDKFDEPRGLRRPIDSFFVSLANIQGPRAASVILSGTGADGSAGMRMIKELGGICVAQSPEEARYDGMPHAALSTELIDYTLTAKEIVARLQAYFSGKLYPDLPESPDEMEEKLQRVLRILLEDLGHDFSGYKRATIFRRLERRLQVLEYTSIDDYATYLGHNPSERRLLFQDFLINVTAFFRDLDSFERLQKHAITPLIEDAKEGDEVRIWVPGCSSGQEAYSIAMLVHEACKKHGKKPVVQIFATDIDEKVIQIARNAQYPMSSLKELPARFQEEYTIGQDGQFEIVPAIRDMVRFSIHSLIKDAPFSKVDLISCRNLLIYLDEKMQHDVLPIFHFSLRPGGMLFLGNSENVTRRSELYDSIDPRSRLFQRRETAQRGQIMLPLGQSRESRNSINTKMAHDEDFPKSKGLDVTNSTIYDQYAPPFVRVSSDGRIIHSSGDLSLFLMSRPGDERHIFALAREGIREQVMPLLADAQRDNRRIALKDIEVPSPFGMQQTDIIAHPFKDGTVALIFIARERLLQTVDEYAVTPASHDQRIADLQEQLQATQLLLKTKIEEVETTNEELKSSNEEMMSMNEELQSSNEELTTANEELKNKIDELSIANADLDNFMQASELNMVVLDRALRIRHLTKAAKEVLPLRENDRGRRITEFHIEFRDFDLPQAIETVFQSGETVEESVTSEDGENHYLLRVVPYFFGDGSVEGTSITLVDLTEIMNLRDDLNMESERLRLALEAGRIGIAELDVETNMVVIDKISAEHLGLDGPGDYHRDETRTNVHSDSLAAAEGVVDKSVKDDGTYELTIQILTDGPEERWIRRRGLTYMAPSGKVKVISAMMDISQEHLDQQRQEMLVQEMSHRVKNLFAVVGSIIASAPKENRECETFADSMLSRVNALSHAYELARKQGPINGVNWSDLLNRILAPHTNNQNIEASGPETFISPDMLTTLTLFFHELTTNALKYGALSVPEGTLKIKWSVDDDNHMDLTWSESLPDFRLKDEIVPGFGNKLMAMAVQQLHGEYSHDFTENGLVMHLRFKLD